MAKLQKATIYLATREDDDLINFLNGALYHEPVLYEIENVGTVDVGGEFSDDHVLNKTSTDMAKLYEDES